LVLLPVSEKSDFELVSVSFPSTRSVSPGNGANSSHNLRARLLCLGV
jgi:hypothetical protein